MLSRGVLFSLLASLLFGVMYYYTSLLAPLTGEEIFGWRTLLTLPLLTIFLLLAGEWGRVQELAQQVRRRPLFLLVLVLSSALLGVQLWLFMWAPLHQMALDVSLGYFMLPLSMILTGRLLYREQLSAWQQLAAFSALLGVGHELYQVGHFSWPALLVALGYPMYFVLRRQCRTDHLGGLWFDMLLTLPVGLIFIIRGGHFSLATLAQQPALYGLVPVLGGISAAALIFYVLSSRYLPFSLFGLLGYVEPVLLVGVSLLLGESIAVNKWWTYLPVWLAVGLLVLEGMLKLRAQAKVEPAPAVRP